MQPPWVMIAGIALAEPNDTEQRHRQPQPVLGREVLPLADVEAVGWRGPVRQVTPLGAAVEPEV